MMCLTQLLETPDTTLDTQLLDTQLLETPDKHLTQLLETPSRTLLETN